MASNTDSLGVFGEATGIRQSGAAGCHAAGISSIIADLRHCTEAHAAGVSSIIAGLRHCTEAFWLNVQLLLASAASLRVSGVVQKHFGSMINVQLFLASAASLRVSGIVQCTEAFWLNVSDGGSVRAFWGRKIT